jgi:hypothetical protein
MRVYCSHPIRGAKGKDATIEDMRANNAKAVKLAAHWKDVLSKAFGKRVDVYVPGEHDEFVALAHNEGYITERQILAIDCKILDTCDLLLVLNEDGISCGMQVEIIHALKRGIPVLYVKDRGEIAGRAD